MQQRNRITTSVLGLLALAGAANITRTDVVVTALVLEEDEYNGFPITSGFAACENMAINNSGVWLVESDTTNPDTTVDGLIIKGGLGSVLFTQG
ncbi:MAG: hypothetical protein KGS45_03250 [Planctomycetes bacterium]|nr:hypothetical protein [Planctomycetota bacterium]